MKENNDIIIYQTEDGVTQIEVRLENETVWLTQQQISELFQRERSVIQDTDCQNIEEKRQAMSRKTTTRITLSAPEA